VAGKGNWECTKKLIAVAVALGIGVWGFAAEAVAPKRVKVSGKIVDTWCYLTEIMFAQGSAHHKCAIWCAVDGIPVSIKGNDGKVYMVLRVKGDNTSVANPKIVSIQSHELTVDGDLYVRDGVNYLLVNKVADDKGVINLTHKKHGGEWFQHDERVKATIAKEGVLGVPGLKPPK